MADLSPILAELEKLYPKLVQRYDGRLRGLVGTNAYTEACEVPPIISLASKGRKRTQMGWYQEAVWVDSKDEVLDALAGVAKEDRKIVQRPEITIATELVHDPVQTASELLRQVIVHFDPNLAGPQGYYPKWFEEYGPSFDHWGRIIPTQKSRGWAGWEPTDKAAWATWVRDNMDTSVFEVTRKDEGMAQRKGSRMKKWTCGCTTIRCATQVIAHCDDCGGTFRWAEQEAAPVTWQHAYAPQDDAPQPQPGDITKAYYRSATPVAGTRA